MQFTTVRRRRAPRNGAPPDPFNDQLVESLGERRFDSGGRSARTANRLSIQVRRTRFSREHLERCGRRWLVPSRSESAGVVLLLTDGLMAKWSGCDGTLARTAATIRYIVYIILTICQGRFRARRVAHRLLLGRGRAASSAISSEAARGLALHESQAQATVAVG